jgi:hypothetical protein
MSLANGDVHLYLQRLSEKCERGGVCLARVQNDPNREEGQPVGACEIESGGDRAKDCAREHQKASSASATASTNGDSRKYSSLTNAASEGGVSVNCAPRQPNTFHLA